MRKTSLVIILCALWACGPPSGTGTAAPSPPSASAPTPKNIAVEESPTSPSAGDEQASTSVEAPAEINLDSADSENRLVKAEVLARIDVMPRLNPEEKDKLYVQVERARGMGRIVTIPFSTGKVSVGSSELVDLKEKLNLPKFRGSLKTLRSFSSFWVSLIERAMIRRIWPFLCSVPKALPKPLRSGALL